MKQTTLSAAALAAIALAGCGGGGSHLAVNTIPEGIVQVSVSGYTAISRAAGTSAATQDLLRLGSDAASGLPWLAALLSPDRWLLWLGLLFVLSVYYFPTGVVGRLRAARTAG